MKRLTTLLVAAALGAGLAACGRESAGPEAQQPAAAADGMAMKDMDMAGAMMASGTGTVTAIDKTAGTVTLDHGPIAAANWPAMEMTFKASPAGLLDAVKVGDKVSFELKLADGTGEVTAMAVQ